MPSATHPPLTPHEARVIDSFKHRPVLRMARLCSSLRLTRMTFFRALAKHGYFRSFNHGGHFFTLKHTPRFDANGLWFYRSIGFSRHRTLIDTVLALLDDSLAGATPKELANLLRTPVSNLLATLARQQRLARRRLGRHVVYLAIDPWRQEQQWRQRQQSRPAQTAPAILSDDPPLSLALPVLVALIRSPQASAEQLARVLRGQGTAPRTKEVQSVVDHFQLEKKEARWRWQNSFRACFAPAKTTCINSARFPQTLFTPSTGWLRRPRPARRCPL